MTARKATAKRVRRLAGAALLAICAALPGQAQDRITVFAAASMADALGGIADAYRSETGTEVVLSLAGTGALARQIEAGAPADIFVSADRQWMDYVRERDAVVPDSIRTVAGNRLVLIGASDAPDVDLSPGGLTAALAGGRLAIADPETVPAGRYGRAALETARLWESVAGHLAPMDNVRVALASVARGDTPLGIVYQSDAQAEPRVRIVALFAPDLYPKIEYQAALTRTAGMAAAAFLEYLTGPEAQGILAKAGFRPISD